MVKKKWQTRPTCGKTCKTLQVGSHQTKLDTWTFGVYSFNSRVKFTTQQTRIRVMGGDSARQLQSRCKMYSCFCKSTKMYIQLRVPTYNHNYFVLHCCFGFSVSARYAILFSFLIFFFFSNRESCIKNCDSQFIQNRAALVYMLLLLHIVNSKRSLIS